MRWVGLAAFGAVLVVCLQNCGEFKTVPAEISQSSSNDSENPPQPTPTPTPTPTPPIGQLPPAPAAPEGWSNVTPAGLNITTSLGVVSRGQT